MRELLHPDKQLLELRYSLAHAVVPIGGACTSKGIGASIAKHLAAEGAAVVVNYVSSKEGAERVVDEITRTGGKAIAGVR